jgi:predicted Rdx family selenoprotein
MGCFNMVISTLSSLSKGHESFNIIPKLVIEWLLGAKHDARLWEKKEEGKVPESVKLKSSIIFQNVVEEKKEEQAV